MNAPQNSITTSIIARLAGLRATPRFGPLKLASNAHAEPHSHQPQERCVEVSSALQVACIAERSMPQAHAVEEPGAILLSEFRNEHDPAKRSELAAEFISKRDTGAFIKHRSESELLQEFRAEKTPEKRAELASQIIAQRN